MLRHGHRVTVWNRTITKAEPLIRDGAGAAADLSSALVASRVLIVCVDNYQVTRDILAAHEVRPLLSGLAALIKLLRAGQ